MPFAELIRKVSDEPLGRYVRDELPVIRGYPQALDAVLDAVPDELPVYVADAICKAHHAEGDPEILHLRSNYPRCLPPHPDVFLEMQWPTKFESQTSAVNRPGAPPASLGWFIIVRKGHMLPLETRAMYAHHLRDHLTIIAEDPIVVEAVDWSRGAFDPEVMAARRRQDAQRDLLATRARGFEDLTAPSFSWLPGRPTPAPGWMLWAAMICLHGKKRLGMPLIVEVDLDEDGSLFDPPLLFNQYCDEGGWPVGVPWHPRWRLLCPALQAFSHLNAGRAELRRQEPTPHRKRRGRPAPQPYWTIERQAVAGA